MRPLIRQPVIGAAGPLQVTDNKHEQKSRHMV